MGTQRAQSKTEVLLSLINNTLTGAMPAGIATEATLLSVLSAIVTSQQDVEILLVKDTGNADEILQQITDYSGGLPGVVTYKDVNGNVVVPVGPIEYMDASAVLNLMLTEMLAQGVILDSIAAEDFATEVTLAAVLAKIIAAPSTEAKQDSANALLTLIEADTGGILTDTNAMVVDLAAIEVEQLAQGVVQDAIATEQLAQGVTLDTIETETTGINTALAIRVRTPALLVVSGVASTTVAAGARSVTFFNQGPTAATVAGGVLDAGESMTFDAGGQRDTLGAIAYVTIATGVLKISTVI